MLVEEAVVPPPGDGIDAESGLNDGICCKSLPRMESEKGRKMSSIAAVILGIFGLWNLFIWKRLTPIYSAASCGHIQAELQDFKLDGTSINVRLQVSVHCQNPNPYAVEIMSSEPGRVLVGAVPGEKLEGQTAVGYLAVIPGSFLPSAGEGIVRVQMNSKIDVAETGQLVPEFLGESEIPILMELRFSVGINVYILPVFPPWAPPTAPKFAKACGLNMMGVFVNQFVSAEAKGKESRLGPLICRDSFEGMVIPPVGEPAMDNKMHFTAAQVAPTEVMAGEIAKDAGLIPVIFCFFFSAAVFTHIGIYGKVPEQLTTMQQSMNMCYSKLTMRFGKAGDTLPWKDLTLLSNPNTSSRDRTQGDPKATEHLLAPKDVSELSLRKDSEDGRTRLASNDFQRPRRESNASGGLNEAESQAMLRAGGAVPTRDSDVSDAQEGRPQATSLLQPDRTLSQHSARQSRSPSRPSRITSARQRGRSSGSDRGSVSGDEASAMMRQDRSRSRLSAQDGAGTSRGLARSRSPSQLRHSSPSYTSMPEKTNVEGEGLPLATVYTDQSDATTKETKV